MLDFKLQVARKFLLASPVTGLVRAVVEAWRSLTIEPSVQTCGRMKKR